MERVLAVDVGGTTVKAEITVPDGTVLGSGSVPTPKGAAAWTTITGLGRSLIEAHGPVTTAGAVLPGIVDTRRRVAIYSANIGWPETDAGSLLEQAWQVPVTVGHDVTAAGLAEWRTGAGTGCTDLAFVAIGTGIAGALVCGGQLLTGTSGRQPGEIGHVVVRPDGPPCGCGARGCLEAITSASAIARSYAAATGEPAAGALDVERACPRDERARAVWDDAMEALADGLVVLATLTAPERIVIGGGLARAGDFLLKPVTAALRNRTLVQPEPELVIGKHGTRAGLAGAAILARDAAQGRPA